MGLSVCLIPSEIRKKTSHNKFLNGYLLILSLISACINILHLGISVVAVHCNMVV